jgi:hypothetical protein
VEVLCSLELGVDSLDLDVTAEWLVLGLKYSPKSFYTRIWRAVVSHTVSFVALKKLK